MNKTPYEIRLEVLKMAQDAELQKYYDQKERVMEVWRTEVASANLRNAAPPAVPELPEFPTQESVVSKAQFLGEYINRKADAFLP